MFFSGENIESHVNKKPFGNSFSFWNCARNWGAGWKVSLLRWWCRETLSYVRFFFCSWKRDRLETCYEFPIARFLTMPATLVISFLNRMRCQGGGFGKWVQVIPSRLGRAKWPGPYLYIFIWTFEKLILFLNFSTCIIVLIYISFVFPLICLLVLQKETLFLQFSIS